MSEQKTPTKPADANIATEKKAYVRYSGKMPSVSHQGAEGIQYFFTKGAWHPISDLDIPNYERKARNNSNSWEIIFKKHTIYVDVHKVKFKGTEQYKDEITLLFDDKDGEKTNKYVFKVDQWTVIADDEIAKQLSNKALQSNAWAYQLDKVAKKIGA